MIPHQQEHGYSRLRDPVQPPRELPLVGLRWVSPLVSVAGQQYQVNSLVHRILNHFVQGTQKVPQPGRKPRCRV